MEIEDGHGYVMVKIEEVMHLVMRIKNVNQELIADH
jgi:hypothetical protein